jgi:hypothetical protein
LLDDVLEVDDAEDFGPPVDDPTHHQRGTACRGDAVDDLA